MTINFIKPSNIENIGDIIQIEDLIIYSGAIYNMVQDIEGLSILNSNLMCDEYIINSHYNGSNVSNNLIIV
ncbi:hypothetical protein [uncultured Methanobrevibacter sp.]|uniref:hypothetical protein n=1 Tax=uncultured Methanobrevibacter sp. TaxID=253161 RepID=UPI0025F92EF0|nr:hypothetical protein [uncultured Methanobrevibacter sp.]